MKLDNKPSSRIAGKGVSLLCLSASCCAFALTAFTSPEPVDFANPFTGTDNTFQISNGNIYPYIAMPWGMNAWSPQTRTTGKNWFYDWKDNHICGFHQTHQPSPWVGDYAQFSVMPMAGRAEFDEMKRASWYSHKTEKATPAYYKVYLADYDITAEMTPTERALFMRLKYPATDSPRFLVDAMKGDAKVEVSKRRVTGYSTMMFVRSSETKSPPKPPKTYFVVEFDRDIVSHKIDKNRAIVTFAPVKRGEIVKVRIASSFISTEQAERNLKELSATFDETHAKARAAWNAQLGRIKVEGGSETDKRKFYTCLYRALIFPRKTHEYDADGKVVHRSFYGKGVVPGFYYCDTGFWDTYRALFPLLNFAYPDRAREMMEGLRHCYEESGWLPEWSAPFHRSAMIGQGSASVVADGYFAGNMDDATARKLYEGLLKSANSRHPTIHSVGRECANEYNKLGYVPMDKCKRSSGARTLEYAYADYCIWKLGVALGRPAEETAVYLKRSGNWRNIWRDDKKSVCARASDGSWDPKYSPIRWDYDFVEGTPLQYTWSIFHDIPGLMEALGGREKFVAALDAVFDQPPSFDGSYYGGCTHEIREMFVSGFGQYAHGNQPIQHMIYLYTLAGRRDRAAYWTRRVMDELYADRPDGYGGDEDNGQTSAWFVWSAMGMYPVCPVSGEYVLGAPLFDKITVSRPGAKSVEITRDSIGGKAHDSPTVKRTEIFGAK